LIEEKEEKKERGKEKRAGFIFEIGKKIYEEEDGMDFFPHVTSTRNESCWSLRVDM
jgi:hypothetical protein